MAITRIGGATAITGTLPDTNINNASLDNVTGLPAGVGGKVLQVITSDFAYVSTTSTTLTTFKTLSITKSNANNKVIIVCSTMMGTDSDGGWSYGKITVLRNDVSTFTTDAVNGGESIPNWILTSVNPTWVDSATDTTAITYKFQFAKNGGSSSAHMGGSHADADGASRYITLMEIAS